MQLRPIATAAMAALLAAGLAGGIAQARDRDGDQDQRDIAALAQLKVTLPQAIAAAEQQSGGRAVSADLSRKGGTTRIAVEVAGSGGVKMVFVDGQTGQVTGTQAGGDDEDDDD